MRKKLTDAISKHFTSGITNLSSYEKAINRLISFLLLGVFLFSVLILAPVYYQLELKEKTAANELLSNANAILQSTLSEQLSIVANNQDFFNYLKEGVYSRQLNTVSMMQLFQNFIDNKLVLGVNLYDAQSNVIFSSGSTNSPFYVNLNLCYLNNQLNNQFGNCNNSLQIFMSQAAYIQRLHRINPNIEACEKIGNCRALTPFSQKFGSFVIRNAQSTPLSITNNTTPLYQFFLPSGVIFLVLIIALLTSQRLIKLLTTTYLARPIQEIANQLKANENLSKERGKYVEEIDLLVDHILEYQQHKFEIDLGKNLASVAHDIRSPLVSLQQYVDEINIALPESDKIFLRNSLTTINDIANTMVSRYKGTVEQAEVDRDVLIVPCILDVLSAKRIEYKNKNIHFDLVVENNIDYFILTHTRPAELKRVLSNLLNNAINAMLPQGGGQVKLSVAGSFLGCSIVIADTGCGVSEERLRDLLSEHPSSQAKIGLGLAHAKAYFKEISGSLEMKSSPGKGTQVYLSLPKINDPSWLISRCKIRDETVVIIDDVQSIHDAWERRLSEIGVTALHFNSPEEFFEALPHFKKELILFSDYEFSNSKLNGLDLLSKAPGSALKVLFTSHFSNEKIMQTCTEKSFKLLPKNLFNFFTLEKAEKEVASDEIKLVFIDDDPENISRWRFFADHKQVKMASYARAEDFIKEHGQYPRNLPIYIDYHLDAEKTGMEYAKEIFELGFTNIYIATGDTHIEKTPWVKGVVEKRFPF